jgi:hypothetical protein
VGIAGNRFHLLNHHPSEGVVIMSPVQQTLKWAVGFLKGQPARIMGYCVASFMAGNWVGTYYPEQSLAFWVQPMVSLVIGIITVMSTLRNNKKIKDDMVVQRYTIPALPPNEKEAAILAKAGIEVIPK